MLNPDANTLKHPFADHLDLLEYIFTGGTNVVHEHMSELGTNAAKVLTFPSLIMHNSASTVTIFENIILPISFIPIVFEDTSLEASPAVITFAKKFDPHSQTNTAWYCLAQTVVPTPVFAYAEAARTPIGLKRFDIGVTTCPEGTTLENLLAREQKLMGKLEYNSSPHDVDFFLYRIEADLKEFHQPNGQV